MKRKLRDWSGLYDYITSAPATAEFLHLEIIGTRLAPTVHARIDLRHPGVPSSEPMVTAFIAGDETRELNITESAFGPEGWKIWLIDQSDLPTDTSFPDRAPITKWRGLWMDIAEYGGEYGVGLILEIRRNRMDPSIFMQVDLAWSQTGDDANPAIFGWQSGDATSKCQLVDFTKSELESGTIQVWRVVGKSALTFPQPVEI